MLRLTFSSKLDWDSQIISIAKTASKKIGALIHSMKFLSTEVALYLYKFIIQSCMEYCFHVWVGWVYSRGKIIWMLRLTFSSKLDWDSYIISITKIASKKIGALIHSMKFLSTEVALYIYKFTIQPCMEYCFHVQLGTLSCYVELLDKLQKHDMQNCQSFTCCLS